MAYLVANTPRIRCYVRKEFLYNFEKGFGEYIPCIWVSIKSMSRRAFFIESYLPEYGALYDKLPLNAYVSRTDNLEPSKFLPLDHLQIWDCLSYELTVIQKSFLLNLSGKVYAKDKQWYQGNYLFTVDNCASDEHLDMGDAENPEDHKSYNFLELDNGQYAAQPNNRCIWFDAASNPKEMKFPDFKVCTKKYIVEQNPKWAIGDSDTVMYE